MFAKILLTISIFKLIDSFYLEASSNYLKPKLERNNIVNKGIWVRNKLQEDLFERNKLGTFIFRPNSVDADHVMQNNLDYFGDNAMQETPFVSNYVQRTRRSPDHIRKRRPRKSMKGKFVKSSIEDSVVIKSKIVTDLKPTSVFNEYPYEVAILLNNYERNAVNHTHKAKHDKKVNNPTPKVLSAHSKNEIKGEEIEVSPIHLSTSVPTNIPKRSKKYDVKYDHVDEMYNYNMIEDQNKTEMITAANKQDRAIFNKEEEVTVGWNLGPQVSNSNVYKMVPKEPPQSKSVTERGLVKVISMLTRTFKKITKQHAEVKDIHDKLTNANQNFDLKITEFTSKFEDFNSKYSNMMQFNNKIKAFEAQMNSQKDYFDLKQKEIQKLFAEFQEQQNNFLSQQRQFYAIQKLMLAQNEKVNAKQSQIAKTQSEISHRQNNLARILKKAKQIFGENKTKLHPTQTTEQKYNLKAEKTIINTTPTPHHTHPMKINLFAIPTKNMLQNQDALIIKEKDAKQIDDLVYKYYFNNTFIDNLMKNKILNNYVGSLSSVEITNRSKQSKAKRVELDTTLMLPVNNSINNTGKRERRGLNRLSGSASKRERRWINHFSKNKYWKGNGHRRRTTNIPNSMPINVSKSENASHANYKENIALNEVKHVDKAKNDPFLTMATKFCNEIGRNKNEQVLKWCVEKALRRLKFMEMITFTPPSVTVNPSEKHIDEKTTVGAAKLTTDVQDSTKYGPLVAKVATSESNKPTGKDQEIFFPDNDVLESNLKQFDLTPDTEGNVYYEGSFHISDFAPITTDSGDVSDIMPGLMDSNSRVDIDPLTFDIQANRRAYVRRLNENIMKQMKG